MTNGEKIKETFPDATVCYTNGPHIGLTPKGENWVIWFMNKWWNSEYKENKSEKKVKTIETEHSCVTCKFGNLYSDSEPCCNCTEDNDMYEPNESEE